LGIGKEDNGLYFLKDEPIAACLAGSTDQEAEDDSIWHKRLGHPSKSVFDLIPVVMTNTNAHKPCEICPLAKQTRFKFPVSDSHSTAIFQLIHIDVWGPYKVPTYDKKHYFVTIVDDHSRYTWLCLVQHKSEVIVVLKDFLLKVHNQFGVTVKVLRSDNGKEFFNSQCSKLFSSLGIVHQSSCAYTPQQNGVVERKHRHILEVARSLKFQSSVPNRFWGDCVRTVVYLINKLPTPVLQGKTPYEMLYHKPPAYDHLRVFGCLCFASTLPKGTKFEARARRTVLIGYSETQKGYKLFDLESGTCLVSRDVLFRENNFPFKSSRGEDEDVFGVHLPEMVTPEDEDIFGVHLPKMVTPPSLEIPEYLPPTSLPNMPSAGDDVQFPSMNVDPYPEPPADIEKLRRTGRSVNPPIWLKDYVTGKKSASSSLYSIDKVLSYDRLSAAYKASIHAFSTHVEPKSFKEAACDPNWVNAMQLEIQALEDNHTWDLISLPVGVHAIGSKWVFKIKYKANGDIEMYKARLVQSTRRAGLSRHILTSGNDGHCEDCHWNCSC